MYADYLVCTKAIVLFTFNKPCVYHNHPNYLRSLMLSFFYAAYACIVPLLLLAGLYKPYRLAAHRLIAVNQLLLLLACMAFWQHLYQLYLSVKPYMPAETSFVQSNFGSVSASMMVYISSYLLPFLFLIRPLRNSRFMAFVMVVLIWFPELQALYQQFTQGLASFPSYYFAYNFNMQVMCYISTGIGMYGFLYLLQSLPGQRSKLTR
jgi:hypothetical protein